MQIQEGIIDFITNSLIKWGKVGHYGEEYSLSGEL